MASTTSTSVLVHDVQLQPLQLQVDNAQSRESVHPNPRDAAPQSSRVEDSAAPDGGQGWVVVAGCAIVAFWMIGTPYSWGVIQNALVEQGVSSPAVLSFVGSLAAALISAMAVINSRVMRTLGPQKTGMLGVTLMGVSGILSSFTYTNVGALFATSGVVLGLGIRYVIPQTALDVFLID